MLAVWSLVPLPFLNPTFTSGSSRFTYCWSLKVKVKLLSRVRLFCDPMGGSPQGSSVHGISQARILEWVTISCSRGSSWHRDRTCLSCICSWTLYHWATWESRSVLCIQPNSSPAVGTVVLPVLRLVFLGYRTLENKSRGGRMNERSITLNTNSNRKQLL